jgi:hypothetical protein
MASGQLEEARTAKRELWRTVRHAGRPAADAERQAVVAALSAATRQDLPADTARDVLWMLSEIGGDDAVATIKPLLADNELREDARMVLERIPGHASLAALQAALKMVPDDFQPNIVQSLRARGVDVPGHPCQKFVPTRATAVKPIE